MTNWIYLKGLIGSITEPEPGLRLAGVISSVISRNEVLVRTVRGVFRALNYRLPARVGLPVIVEYENSGWVVVSLDHLVLPELGNVHYVPYHHDAHEFQRAEGGDDVVWVQKQQFTPLLVTPTSPPSRSVRVFPGVFVSTDLTIKELSNAYLVDLSEYFGDRQRYAVVALDLETGLPTVDVYDTAPQILPGTVPLAQVRLRPGATLINWTDILDARDIPPTLGAIALAGITHTRMIARYSNGQVYYYEASNDGLQNAVADATAGDRIIVQCGHYDCPVSIPAGVVVDFSFSLYTGIIRGEGVAVNFIVPEE